MWRGERQCRESYTLCSNGDLLWAYKYYAFTKKVVRCYGFSKSAPTLWISLLGIFPVEQSDKFYASLDHHKQWSPYSKSSGHILYPEVQQSAHNLPPPPQQQPWKGSPIKHASNSLGLEEPCLCFPERFWSFLFIDVIIHLWAWAECMSIGGKTVVIYGMCKTFKSVSTV